MGGDPGTSRAAPNAEVREALHELQRYFSDELAPMMAAESVGILLRLPPQLMASAIQGWVGTQYRGKGAEVPVSDYLFHAVKKLYQMAEYRLIAKPVVRGYLARLAPLVLGICPAEDRRLLRDNLSRLGRSGEAALVGSVEILHRQAGRPDGGRAGGARDAAGREEAGAASAEVARGMRRFSMLLERLGGTAGAPAGAAPELTPEILATAAAGARSADEFGRYMERLKDAGLDPGMEQVFRMLGRTVPGWAMTGEDAAAPASRAVRAMHRIISMAESPEQAAARFNEMIKAAIEQFNEGSLARAATMIGLARKIVAERRLPDDVVRSIRRNAQSGLSVEQMRHYADAPERHASLRRVLGFFPAYSVRGLLAALNGEPRRERRRMMLALLEVHGAATREAALDLLTKYAEDASSDPHGYFVRNLVHLLRRVRPAEGQVDERETELLGRHSQWGAPPLVMREVMAALGEVGGDKAEEILIARLQETEQLLVQDGGGHDPDDLRVLLHWTVGALARLGTPDALGAVVDHGFERHAALGDPMARLQELGGQDLSSHPELVARLVDALRRGLPKRVLGLVVGKDHGHVPHLIRALARTPLPEVRQILEEIVERYRDQGFAADASKVLAGFGTPRPSQRDEESSSLTGDVELFGLPNLLQSLADSRVEGTLALVGREQEPIGTMVLRSGRISRCESAGLTGEEAFYRLFEKPAPGTFVFRRRRPDAPAEPEEGGSMEVMPAILEALRRYDEFQQACALVPDGATFRRTGEKPTPADDEEDLTFMREVWVKASAATPPERCEAEIPVDPYRIRRLYAHWLETGALQAAPASPGTCR